MFCSAAAAPPWLRGSACFLFITSTISSMAANARSGVGSHRQIDELWQKHRVLITHVAVKLTKGLRDTRHDFSGVYERAVNVQHLRNKLQPRFRRL